MIVRLQRKDHFHARLNWYYARQNFYLLRRERKLESEKSREKKERSEEETGGGGRRIFANETNLFYFRSDYGDRDSCLPRIYVKFFKIVLRCIQCVRVNDAANK